MKIRAASSNSHAIRFVQPMLLVGLSAGSVSRTIPVNPYQVIDRDSILSRSTGIHRTDYQLRPETFGGAGKPVFSYESLNSSVAEVDSSGYVEQRSAGTCTLRATSGSQQKDVAIVFQPIVEKTADTFVNFSEGSLAHSISASVDGRIIGKDPISSKPLYSTLNHAEQIYARNSGGWCADIDVSCVSVWNSAAGPQMAGTLISPRHVLFAAHFQPPAGTTIRFVGADSVTVTRTVSALLTHPLFTPYYPDVTIGILNSDVPSSISFAKILPSSWAQYIPTIDSTRTIPCLCLDQEKKGLVGDYVGVEYGKAIFSRPYTVNASQRGLFYEDKIGGDSGSPAFLIVGGSLVLLTTWTYGGAGIGTFLADQASAINTMMATLGGGYQLTLVDLSSFPTY